MGQLLSSKVITQEEDPKLRNFEGGETGVAVFIGTAIRGPIGVATLCAGWDDYYLKFGGHADGYSLPIQVEHFFKDKGRRCYVVRTVHYSDLDAGTHTAGTGTLNLQTAGIAAAPAVVELSEMAPWFVQNGETLIAAINAGADKTVTFTGGSAKLSVTPAGIFPWTPAAPETVLLKINDGAEQTLTIPGNGATTYADIQAVIDVLNPQLQDAQVYEDPAVAGDLVIETGRQGSSARVEITGGTAIGVGELNLEGGDEAGTGNVPDLSTVELADLATLIEAAWVSDEIVPGTVQVAEDASGDVTISTEKTGAAASIEVSAASTALLRFGIVAGLYEGSATAKVDTLQVDGKTPGSYTDDLKIVVATASNGKTDYFNLYVRYQGVSVETWPNMIMDDTNERHPETLINATKNGSNWIVVTDLEAGLGATLGRPENTAAAGAGPLVGGTDGLTDLDDNDFTGSEVSGAGLRAADIVLDFDLLGIPDRHSATLKKAVVDYCKDDRKRRVFPVFGPPDGLTAEEMRDFAEDNGLWRYDEQGAMFWPRIKCANPSKSIYGSADELTVDPVGSLCGMFARNDNRELGGIYQNPANSELGILYSATGLETDEAKKEKARDLVYPANVNPITIMPGTAVFNDGSRTLKDNGNFPSIAERRGVSYIEKTVADNLSWARHRNNDAKLRQQVKRSIVLFLKKQMDAGAFRYTDPTKAFFVDVSEQLNTPDVVLAKQLKVRVGLATQKPAEWIILNFSQNLADLEDVLASAGA